MMLKCNVEDIQEKVQQSVSHHSQLNQGFLYIHIIFRKRKFQKLNAIRSI